MHICCLIRFIVVYILNWSRLTRFHLFNYYFFVKMLWAKFFCLFVCILTRWILIGCLYAPFLKKDWPGKLTQSTFLRQIGLHHFPVTSLVPPGHYEYTLYLFRVGLLGHQGVHFSSAKVMKCCQNRHWHDKGEISFFKWGISIKVNTNGICCFKVEQGSCEQVRVITVNAFSQPLLRGVYFPKFFKPLAWNRWGCVELWIDLLPF